MSYALISFLHPWSPSKSDRLQSLLATAQPYYLSDPASLCSTWCFFTPSTRPKAPFKQLSLQPAVVVTSSSSSSTSTSSDQAPPPQQQQQQRLMISSVEIYASRAGLTRQLEKPWFKDFQESVKQESLYAREEEVSAWRVAGGFVSREDAGMGKREMHRKGTVVMLARFECKDGEGARERVVASLAKFADWVKHNEPATYTYSVLVRNSRKPNAEVIMFERYRDAKAIAEHGGRKEFKAMFKEILPHIQAKKTTMAEWEELEFSFVGEGEGEGGDTGEAVGRAAKL